MLQDLLLDERDDTGAEAVAWLIARKRWPARKDSAYFWRAMFPSWRDYTDGSRGPSVYFTYVPYALDQIKVFLSNNKNNVPPGIFPDSKEPADLRYHQTRAGAVWDVITAWRWGGRPAV